MSELNRITVDPGQCGGRPCLRGLRIRVKDVLDLLRPARAATKFSAITRCWKSATSRPRSNTPRDANANLDGSDRRRRLVCTSRR